MLSAEDLKQRKGGDPLALITAYDLAFARIAEAAGFDAVLVGDSLANVMLGKDRTSEINMDTMLIFVEAVVRGAPNTHIIADMPYGSYDNPEEAVRNARKFADVGAGSVKLEGPRIDCISAINRAGIPVMGHLGLLPQTASSLKQVGRTESERSSMVEDAKKIEAAGAYALVLEHTRADAARTVTEALKIPTIGVGAGPHTDGQILVLHDALGMYTGKLPPFAKAFAQVYQEALKGMRNFAGAVRTKTFPPASE